MNRNNVVIGLGFIVLALVSIMFFMYIGASNREISLRNAFNSQMNANKVDFDKTWKIIKEQAKVSEGERESFRKTYVEIMEAKQGMAGNGQLASFLTESKVDITPDLFKKLMTTIESQRESFNESQRRLISIKNEHDNLRTQFPSSVFIGGRPELQIVLVTSTYTENIFVDGKDDQLWIE